jgi:menaquinone-dependent protoporphyrinogen oxidase
MKLLILYSTTEGHTRKIAEFLQAEAQKNDCEVTLQQATPHSPLPNVFDAVIIASPIHAGQYENDIVDYATRYASQLNERPTAFYSVGLSITRNDPEALKSLYDAQNAFLRATGWQPLRIEQVAGALLYSKYGFFKKMLVRSIMKKAGGDTDTSKDYEYTNWEKLRVAFREFIGEYAIAGV